jgi:hypothetical protein
MGGTVRTPDLSSVVVWVVALVALLFSTALLWQNLRLRADLERFSGGLSGPAEAVPGDRVPPFQAITLKGREKTVSYVGRRGYVLLFFSPKCRVCDEQFSLWERLSGKIRRECWEILAVSRDPLEETRSWAQGRDLGFDIVALPERALWRLIASRLSHRPSLSSQAESSVGSTPAISGRMRKHTMNSSRWWNSVTNVARSAGRGPICL